MIVLDASALLALLQDEPGAERVLAALPEAVIGAANLSEAAARLLERGVTEAEARAAIGGLDLDVRPLDAGLAWATAALRPTTKAAGLGLGDRACLALAGSLGAPALTADRAWAGLADELGIVVELVR